LTNASKEVPASGEWTREDLPPEVCVALDAALDKLGRAPAILRVTELAGYTDWVLIVSGRSERHVQAITDAVQRSETGKGRRARGTDGLGAHLWDLLDYDDFIVHVFYHPVRAHYDLESMWSDAPRVRLDLPDEVMNTDDLDRLDTPDGLPAYRGEPTFGGFDDEFDDDDDDDDDELDPDELEPEPDAEPEPDVD
jgi:ribosome-associated protein